MPSTGDETQIQLQNQLILMLDRKCAEAHRRVPSHILSTLKAADGPQTLFGKYLTGYGEASGGPFNKTEIAERILWVGYYFFYPRSSFSPGDARAWLSIGAAFQSDLNQLMDQILSQDSASIERVYCSPSMAVESVTEWMNSSTAPPEKRTTGERLVKSVWVYHCAETPGPVIDAAAKQALEHCWTSSEFPGDVVLCYCNRKYEVFETRLVVGRERAEHVILTEHIGPATKNFEVRSGNFAKEVFDENPPALRRNGQNTSWNPLHVPTHYARVPLLYAAGMHMEAHVALRSDPAGGVTEALKLIDQVWFGLRNLATMVNDRVAFYATQPLDLAGQLRREYLDILNSPADHSYWPFIHPATENAGPPRHAILYKWFQEMESTGQGNHFTLWKGLYEPTAEIVPSNFTPLALQTLLKSADIKLELQEIDANRKINYPAGPGIAFLIPFLEFINELKWKSGTKLVRLACDDRQVQLQVPLDKNWERLESLFHSSDDVSGGASKALRSVLFCIWDPHKKLETKNKHKAIPPRPLSTSAGETVERREANRMFVRADFRKAGKGGELVLSWPASSGFKK